MLLLISLTMEGHVIRPVSGVESPRRATTLAIEDVTWWLPKPTLLQFLSSVTFWAYVVQILVFVVAVTSYNGLASSSANSTFGPTYCALISMGAKFSPFIVNRNQYWRIISASFIHSGIITLIVSLVLQYVMMLATEMQHEKPITICIFILCGATGYAFSAVANPSNIDTGALPSVMGFVGFRVAHDVFDWPALLARDRRRVGFVEAVTTFICLIVGQSPFVDSYASFAGFVTGCFLGGAFFSDKVENVISTQRIVFAMAALALSFLVFVCAFLLAAGDFPLTNEALWTTVCVSSAETLTFLPLAQPVVLV